MKLKPFLSKHIRDDKLLLFRLDELARGLDRLRVELERLETVRNQEKEVKKNKLS